MGGSLFPDTPRTLIQKISNGDEISWQDFYNTYGDVVRRIAAGQNIQDVDADEIVQQVMLDFCRNNQTGKFRFNPDIAHFRTYFGRIIAAKLSDYWRQRYRETEKAKQIAKSSEIEQIQEESFMREWRVAMFCEAETRLCKRVGKETFLTYSLLVKQNRPVEKVAEFIGCSRNQVYQATKRCVAILRELIAELNSADTGLKLKSPDL